MTDDVTARRLAELEAKMAFLDRFVDKAHNKAVEAEIKAEVVKQMVEHQLLVNSMKEPNEQLEKLYSDDFGQGDNDSGFRQEVPVHIPMDIPKVPKVEVSGSGDSQGSVAPSVDHDPSPTNKQLYEEILG